VPRKPRWKIVLQKEARAKREVVDSLDVFIITIVETLELTTPQVVSRPSQVPSLIGAIDLSPKDNLLAQATY
jgi:hypothetical protein